MDLYPAIDLRHGRCVRLVQGDYSRQTVYGGDPLAVAKELEADGAPWIHVVDLDGARTGRPENRAVLAAIVDAVSVPVQASGGIRDEFSAEALLAGGVTRIVMGTAAVEEPATLRRLAVRHPRRVALGLDSRAGEVAVRGWTEAAGTGAEELLARFQGVELGAVVVTDITRDGTLSGPDVSGLASVLAVTPLPVIASGGVGSLDDLRTLSGLEAGGRRLEGVIVGKALHEGAFTVGEAIAACAPSG